MSLYIIKDTFRRNNCISFIQSVNIEKPIQVEIKPYKKHRSTSQNRLMWTYLNTLSDSLGYDPDHMHELCKTRFLGIEVHTVLNEKVTIPKSTKKLTVEQFADYLKRIELLAQSMGVPLPNPDDRRYALMEQD